MNAVMTQKDFEVQRKEKLHAELVQVKEELHNVRQEVGHSWEIGICHVKYG